MNGAAHGGYWIMKQISYIPIGIIHSPFKKAKGSPIQSATAGEAKGCVEIYSKYTSGLKDLEGFSHVILLYHFHLSKRYSLTVRPFLDQNPHGLFATRAPARPNPIGLSVVRLAGIEGAMLSIDHVDILDGTPLLDIKPYVPEFDAWDASRTGWLNGSTSGAGEVKADDRFSG